MVLSPESNKISDYCTSPGFATSPTSRKLDMDSVHIGVFRDSMANNPLLLKPKIGKPISRGLILPGPDFVYGVVTTRQDGGVAKALSSWHAPVQSFSHSAQCGKTERDFVALNREGVKCGLVTAKELQQYRA
ncbi:DUF4483 domain-containing protein, partial [Listeria monocytogenes]|nr:DUF4483 domain-containing protein [Listeria monocytogenes]